MSVTIGEREQTMEVRIKVIVGIPFTIVTWVVWILVGLAALKYLIGW